MKYSSFEYVLDLPKTSSSASNNPWRKFVPRQKRSQMTWNWQPTKVGRSPKEFPRQPPLGSHRSTAVAPSSPFWMTKTKLRNSKDSLDGEWVSSLFNRPERLDLGFLPCRRSNKPLRPSAPCSSSTREAENVHTHRKSRDTIVPPALEKAS